MNPKEGCGATRPDKACVRDFILFPRLYRATLKAEAAISRARRSRLFASVYLVLFPLHPRLKTLKGSPGGHLRSISRETLLWIDTSLCKCLVFRSVESYENWRELLPVCFGLCLNKQTLFANYERIVSTYLFLVIRQNSLTGFWLRLRLQWMRFQPSDVLTNTFKLFHRIQV